MIIKSKISGIYKLLPANLRQFLFNIKKDDLNSIDEIRMRKERYLTAYNGVREYFVTRSGELDRRVENAVKVSESDMLFTFNEALQNSIHSFEREIKEGYVVYSGGCRVGFCGTAVIKDGRLCGVRDISSINIRIAREIQGCADEIIADCFCKGLKSILILGPPSSGKTTVLRDLSRRLGERYKISLIDEKNEIGAVFNGVPQNTVGDFTDIFNSYKKYDGIITAVRIMSPDMLICDEIGTLEDEKALEYAINSGVKIAASAHSDSFEDAIKRPYIKNLISRGAFDKLVMLGTGESKGTVTAIKDVL